jgi:hypothetical protein
MCTSQTLIFLIQLLIQVAKIRDVWSSLLVIKTRTGVGKVHKDVHMQFPEVHSDEQIHSLIR